MNDQMNKNGLSQKETSFDDDFLASDENENVNPEKAAFDRKVNNITVIETVLTFSWGVVLLVGLLVTIISFMSGHRGMRVVIQTASITLVLGIILWIVSWVIAKGLFEVEKKIQDEEKLALEQSEMLGEE